MHEDEECMHRMEFNPSESSTDCIIAAAVECSETEQPHLRIQSIGQIFGPISNSFPIIQNSLHIQY